MINSQTQEIMANKKSSQPSSLSLFPQLQYLKAGGPLGLGWRPVSGDPDVSLLCDDEAGPWGPVGPVI